MSIGLNPTKEQLDATAGDICRAIEYHLRRARNLKAFLDAKTTAQLVALGYDEAGIDPATGLAKLEASTLKSGIDKVDELRRIYEGLATKATAEDMRTFPRRLSGLGDV